jgi:hypothetical protein
MPAICRHTERANRQHEDYRPRLTLAEARRRLAEVQAEWEIVR